jgi:cytochrome o ubiquinol oxidase subunit II
MTIKSKALIIILLFVDILLIGWLLLHGKNIAVLNPKGMVASQERGLMLFALVLMLTLAIPLFIFTFFVAWRYREGNTKAKYTPEWNHSTKLQILWWGVPFVLVCVLAVVTWIYTHKLEPQKHLAVGTKTMVIQVVALRWKWLFIYPEQKIATVNFVAFPEKTPIEFDLTADEATMNSFWIPNLGGQLYAMTGMVNRLNLMADEQGNYNGSNAEISGRGFAGMRFMAKAVSQNDFDIWVSQMKQSTKVLTLDAYKQLVKPSENYPQTFYSSTPDNLFTTIVNKYMAPSPTNTNMHNTETPGMNMQNPKY